MRPRSIEHDSAPHPEILPGGEVPSFETLTKLETELLRLANQTESHWSCYLDCLRDKAVKTEKAREELIESCTELILFFEGTIGTGPAPDVDAGILQKARDEYEIACELLNKVLR